MSSFSSPPSPRTVVMNGIEYAVLGKPSDPIYVRTSSEKFPVERDHSQYVERVEHYTNMKGIEPIPLRHDGFPVGGPRLPSSMTIDPYRNLDWMQTPPGAPRYDHLGRYMGFMREAPTVRALTTQVRQWQV